MNKSSIEHKALKNIAKLQSQLLRMTCRLVRLNKHYELKGFASGFIVERSGSLFLLSAGHALNKGSWCLETDVSFENTHETLLIPLNEVLLFKAFNLDTTAMEDMEFAFARFDRTALEQKAKKDKRLLGKHIEFTAYRGPLDHEPILGNGEYSYASWKRQPVQEASKMFLHRGATGEFGMTYKGKSPDEKVYHFALAGAHKGHDYYKGASGSPITDAEGKGVSLLLGGDNSTNTLYGLPIKDYIQLLDVDFP